MTLSQGTSLGHTSSSENMPDSYSEAGWEDRWATAVKGTGDVFTCSADTCCQALGIQRWQTGQADACSADGAGEETDQRVIYLDSDERYEKQMKGERKAGEWPGLF